MHRIKAIAIGSLCGLAVFAAAHLSVGNAEPDMFAQDNFPCHEDALLGFAPHFGADKVGCIHIDDVASVRGLDMAEPDLFKQANFPCLEDEALVFVDTPSKDETGCVHQEDVTHRHLTQ